MEDQWCRNGAVMVSADTATQRFRRDIDGFLSRFRPGSSQVPTMLACGNLSTRLDAPTQTGADVLSATAYEAWIRRRGAHSPAYDHHANGAVKRDAKRMHSQVRILHGALC